MLSACFVAVTLSGRDLEIQSGNNSWTTLEISSSDLVDNKAGQNLNSSYSSSTNQLIMSIVNSGNDDQYSVGVVISSTLPNGMKISVLRTGDGSGTGTIAGGDSSAIDVGTSERQLFYGTRDRSSVPVQVILSGVSLGASPDQYIRYLTFTVHEGLIE